MESSRMGSLKKASPRRDSSGLGFLECTGCHGHQDDEVLSVGRSSVQSSTDEVPCALREAPTQRQKPQAGGVCSLASHLSQHTTCLRSWICSVLDLSTLTFLACLFLPTTLPRGPPFHSLLAKSKSWDLSQTAVSKLYNSRAPVPRRQSGKGMLMTNWM